MVRPLNAFVDAYNGEFKKFRAQSGGELEPLQNRLRTIEAQLQRAIDLVVKGVIDDSDAAQTVADLKRQREEIERQLAACQAPSVIHLDRPAAQVFAETIANLAASINGEDSAASSEARGVFRELVEKVVITPVPKSKPRLTLYGKLAGLVACPRDVGGISGSGGPLPPIPTPTGYTLQAEILLSASGGLDMLAAWPD